MTDEERQERVAALFNRLADGIGAVIDKEAQGEPDPVVQNSAVVNIAFRMAAMTLHAVPTMELAVEASANIAERMVAECEVTIETIWGRREKPQ